MLVLAKKRMVRLQRWARKRAKKFTLQQKILGGLVVGVASVSTILMLVFHSQILHAMLPVASKLRSVHPAPGGTLVATCIASGMGEGEGARGDMTLTRET